MSYKKILSLFIAGTLLFSTCGSRVYAEEDTGESATGAEQDNQDQSSVSQEALTYKVKKGDCLWRIAKRFLGDGARYTDIIAWNEDLIRDPSLIYPGMELRIILDSYVPSVIDGKTWKSEWLGMQLELPDGFEFRDEDEYFGEMNASGADDNLSGDPDDYGIIEFFAVNPSALFSVALLEIEKTDFLAEEYVETFNSIVAEALGDDYEWGKEGTERIGGRSFEHYFAKEELKEEYMYVAICLDYYITRIDDKIVMLFTAYIDMDSETSELLGDYYADHGIDELMDGFSAYSGALTQHDEEVSEQDGNDLQTDGTQHAASDQEEHILSETMKLYEGDGSLASTTLYEFEYDAVGNVVRNTEYNDSGDVVRWYEYEYDKKGNVTNETYAVEYMDTWETDVYKGGEWLESIHDGKGMPGHGGEARVYQWTYEYDERDNPVRTVYESSSGNKKLTLCEYEYDEAGNAIKETSYIGDPDGGDDKELSEWTESSYDEENRVTESTTYDRDGVVQVKTKTEYTFDDEGNMTTTIHYQDDDAVMWFVTNKEGIQIGGGYQSSPNSEYQMTSDFEFDEKGNYIRTTDYDKNGNIIFYTTWEYEYETGIEM